MKWSVKNWLLLDFAFGLKDLELQIVGELSQSIFDSNGIRT